MCILFLILMLGPRVGLFFYWLFYPATFSASFSSFIWPLLGIIFIPWTTLMYIIVLPGGINGWDWFWLGLMLIVDFGSHTGAIYGNRGAINEIGRS